MLIFGGMLSALQNDKPLSPMLRALAQGFQMGLDAELVIARKLEDGWDQPLADWQRELNLRITTLVPSHQDPTVRVTQTTQDQ